MSITLPQELSGWLAESAQGLDLGEIGAEEILPRLASAGLARIGVPEAEGGSGGDVVDAVGAVAAVARESLSAAFILWGHRSYIEFLLHSDNVALRERQLPDLLTGRIAGASALSNVMKSLAGLEPLKVRAKSENGALVVDGKLPWVTDLRRDGFHVAAAADGAESGAPMILAISHDDPGLERSADLDLMAMRSSDTAALTFTGLRLSEDRIITRDARNWLPRVRPSFMALQCGMSIGLAARAIDEAEARADAGRGVLGPDIRALQADLSDARSVLAAGLRSQAFVRRPEALFDLRIRLAGIVSDAVELELQAGGGRCYLRGPGADFARRWREAAFIPVITPSIVQLRTELAAARQAA